MARAGNETEELRGGVDEIKDLRNEEQEQSLAEVSQDANDSEHHPREVAVRVPHEDPRGEPVVLPQREGDADEREEHVERE